MSGEDKQDFVMRCGDSKDLVITVRNTARELVDLTGATIRWWLGKSVTSTGNDVLLKKAMSVPGDMALVSDGVFKVIIKPADTETLPPGEWYHEGEVIFPDNAVATVTSGMATLKPSLVKAPT